MKQSVGMTFTLNIVVIFILIAFAFLLGVMGYSKAFRLSSKIVNEIEKCEGYNSCSIPEINRILGGYGYRTGIRNCSNISGATLIQHADSNFDYCIYEDGETKQYNGQKHYRYIVRTYIYYDFPLVDEFKFRLDNKTNWIVYLKG